MTAFSSCSKQRLQLVDRESRAPQDGTKCPRADRPGTVNRDCGASGQVIAMAERDVRADLPQLHESRTLEGAHEPRSRNLR
jgi:hypothetical protein